jgi:hypothetical protein
VFSSTLAFLRAFPSTRDASQRLASSHALPLFIALVVTTSGVLLSRLVR